MARRKLGFMRRFAVSVVKPTMLGLTRPAWRGMENIPATGPAILVANHMSHADPLVLAHYVFDAGRWPGFLAKEGVFHWPVLGKFFLKVGQIPVKRGTADAAKALTAAVSALNAGEAVIIYPEGTTTREPELWPMRGKTGAARLWLSTRAPVIPIVMWGPEQIFDPRTKKLSVRPRQPVTVVAGPALDLRQWDDASPNGSALFEITEKIMMTLRDMLAEIRGAEAPPLWSPGGSREKPGGGDSSASLGEAGDGGSSASVEETP